jgi:hypothetical protein
MTHSSELPITEWWDPENDVWTVPSGPYDYQDVGAGMPPAEMFDAWWVTWDFVSEVDYIMTGSRYYAPDDLYQHQLTTGAERPYEVCKCRTELTDAGTEFHARYVRNPACAADWCLAEPHPMVRTYNAPPACTCRYGLHPTIWYPTHLIDVPGVGQRSAAYTFRIDPRCLHHGDSRYFDEAEPWITLDDQERRGE